MNRQRSLNHSDSSLRSGLQKAWAIWFLLAIHALVVMAGFAAPYSFDAGARASLCAAHACAFRRLLWKISSSTICLCRQSR